MNSFSDLLLAINDLEEVKKFKKYEKLVEHNPIYKEKLDLFFEYQKQMTNAKHLELTNCYLDYKDKYDALSKELNDDVLINIYLDYLSEMNLLTKGITSIIEDTINKNLNSKL